MFFFLLFAFRYSSNTTTTSQIKKMTLSSFIYHIKSDTHSLFHKHTHTLFLSLTHTHTYTHAHSFSFSLSTHIHALPLSLALHTHSHTLSLSHKHIQILPVFYRAKKVHYYCSEEQKGDDDKIGVRRQTQLREFQLKNTLISWQVPRGLHELKWNRLSEKSWVSLKYKKT